MLQHTDRRSGRGKINSTARNTLREVLNAGASAPEIDVGGSTRRVTTDVTLRWISDKLSACGVTRVAEITGLDRVGIPVAIAIRPLAKSISVSQGKGISLEAAKVAAIMESIEVWHAENLPPPAVMSSYERLTRERQCYSVIDLLPDHDRLDLWDESITEQWHLAFEVMSASETLVPESVLSLDTVGRSVASSTSVPTTNGLASGNDLFEAICHSVFEIIERHGFTVWYRLGPEKRAETSIDLTSIRGLNGSLIRRIWNAGLRLNVFDLTDFSLGLPCYLAEISGYGDSFVSRPYTGRGLHVSAEIALTRAITECAQSRLSMISGAREDNLHEDYYLSRNAQQAKAARKPTALDPDRLQQWTKDPIEYLRNLLLEHGFHRWIIYDHTRSDLQIPVVHGFVPGMEHTKV